MCGYIEQVLSGTNVTLHTVYYNMELSARGLVIPGLKGGRYGNQEEMEEMLRSIAQSGCGRFHHFRVSGKALVWGVGVCVCICMGC